MAFLIVQLKKVTGNRVRERWNETQQMVPRLGVEPRPTAARTKPLYMGRLLYQLSQTAPPFSNFFVSSLWRQKTAETDLWECPECDSYIPVSMNLSVVQQRPALCGIHELWAVPHYDGRAILVGRNHLRAHKDSKCTGKTNTEARHVPNSVRDVNTATSCAEGAS